MQGESSSHVIMPQTDITPRSQHFRPNSGVNDSVEEVRSELETTNAKVAFVNPSADAADDDVVEEPTDEDKPKSEDGNEENDEESESESSESSADSEY